MPSEDDEFGAFFDSLEKKPKKKVAQKKPKRKVAPKRLGQRPKITRPRKTDRKVVSLTPELQKEVDRILFEIAKIHYKRTRRDR